MKADNLPDQVDVEVGARIRISRKAKGISQSDLAHAIGLTFQQVQKYEKGSNRVSMSMIVKIAAKLETTVAALAGEHDDVKTPTSSLTMLAKLGAPQLLENYTAMSREAQIALLGVSEQLIKK